MKGTSFHTFHDSMFYSDSLTGSAVFSYQITDFLLESGNIEQSLAVHPHLQTQVVAGRVYLVFLEPTRHEDAVEY